MYKRAEALFWTSEDINFAKDAAACRALPREMDKGLLSMCLAYMSLQNTFEKYPLEGRLCDEIQAPEARCMFGFFMMQKNIHMEMFSVLLTKVFDQDSAALAHLVSSIEVLPYLELRHSFVKAYISDPEVHFSIKLIAIISMVSLCSKSIKLILLLIASNALNDSTMKPQYDLALQSMPNLLFGLAKMQKDEDTFIDFCVMLFKENINTRPKAEVAHHIISDAVEMEFKLLENIMDSSRASTDIVGTLKSSISACANGIADHLGYKRPNTTLDTLAWTKHYMLHILSLHEPETELSAVPHAKARPVINDTTTAFTITDNF